MVTFFVEHEGGDPTSLSGPTTGLGMDPNSSPTDAKLVNRAVDSMRRGRH